MRTVAVRASLSAVARVRSSIRTEKRPVPLTVIGVIEAEPGLRAAEHGEPVTLPIGFDHFR